jgi:hypothetical protein
MADKAKQQQQDDEFDAKITIGDQEYDLPGELTLGEESDVKKKFGVRWVEIDDLLAQEDADACMAFVYVILRRGNPTAPETIILQQVQAMSRSELGAAFGRLSDALQAEQERERKAKGDKARPTESEAGDEETTPPSDGDPVTDTSTP